MNFIVTEIFLKKDCEHGRYFKFSVGRENYYKTATALNAFFNNPHTHRNYKKKEILYHSQLFEEFEMSNNITEKSYKKLGIELRPKKLIELNSIWEFFEVIGFDNKTKKWVK